MENLNTIGMWLLFYAIGVAIVMWIWIKQWHLDLFYKNVFDVILTIWILSLSWIVVFCWLVWWFMWEASVIMSNAMFKRDEK